MADRFPIQSNRTSSVPWASMEPLRKSCSSFHGQTLERLAERGGLSAGELQGHVVAVAEGRVATLRDMYGRDETTAESWLVQWVMEQW